MDKVSMVPGFILKLWKMINDPQCDVIIWSDDGQSFIVIDPPRFSNELSKYFKHNNLSSFVRQLNMYGFRKVATLGNNITDDLHFYHQYFIKDKPELLELIKRKLPQKIADNVDLSSIVKGISDIKDKHDGITKALSEIKRENEMLWTELHDLRQKHQQQQIYISNMMRFVSENLEHNGIKLNMLPKSNTPLMIEGTSHELGPLQPYVEPTNEPMAQSMAVEPMEGAAGDPTGGDPMSDIMVQNIDDGLRNMAHSTAEQLQAEIDSAAFEISNVDESVEDILQNFYDDNSIIDN